MPLINLGAWMPTPVVRQRWRLLLVISAAAIALLFSAVPGSFITDENNYLNSVLALRDGSFLVRGTSDLPTAAGLAYFNPYHPVEGKELPSGWQPVAGIPPLYPFFALLFGSAGFGGLAALNVLAFAVALFCVYVYAGRFCSERSSAAIAATAFGAGTYVLEYAQGIWPHMLSIALCMASVLAASYARRGPKPLALAAVAGLLIGLATGIRYQNIFFAACLGLGLLLWSQRRVRCTLAFAGGVALPLFASASLNYWRLGVFTPIGRETNYFAAQVGLHFASLPVEAAWVFVAKILDFTAHPAMPGIAYSWMHKDPLTGVTLLAGVPKKALLQSIPWLLVPLVALLSCWQRQPRSVAIEEAAAQKREFRSLSLIVLPNLAAFCYFGFARIDGLAFNQRYLLELTPLLAVALAWSIERIPLGRTPLLLGGLLGLILVAGGGVLLPHDALLLLVMKGPLVLGGVFLVLWLLARKELPRRLFPVVLGACIAWAGAVHFLQDMTGSWRLRAFNHARAEAVRDVLPEKSALFAWWGNKDAFGPLQLDKDLLIVDSCVDSPEVLNRLIHAMLGKGRRVFVLPNGMPEDRLRGMLAGFAAKMSGRYEVSENREVLQLIEVTSAAPAVALPVE